MHRHIYSILVIAFFVFFQIGCASLSAPAPLLTAAKQGETFKVEELLAGGADPNIKDSDGRTPLMKAAGEGGYSVEVWGSGRMKSTPVPSRGNAKTIQILLEHGAKPNLQDRWGSTALLFASKYGRNESVLTLLSGGADLNLTSNNITPFQIAADRGHLDVAKILLNAGSNIEASDKHGQTSLISSSYNGNIQIVRFLLDNGANVNHSAQGGNTPLSNAAFMGHVEVAKLLLQRGAKLNAKDEEGKTSLAIARERGKSRMVEFLIASGGKE